MQANLESGPLSGESGYEERVREYLESSPHSGERGYEERMREYLESSPRSGERGYVRLTAMRIGIDFDNTIVCYDELFYRLARERDLIPPTVAASKRAVRDYLRAIGNEPAWTELQGDAYGPRLAEAEPFPGVVPFFADCHQCGLEAFVVSHKTRFPFAGPQHDLHQAARDWLERHLFVPGTGLNHERVFLELTKEEKLDRIAALGCEYFVDDLPEFLSEPGFPKATERILFDPANEGSPAGMRRVTTWNELSEIILGPCRC